MGYKFKLNTATKSVGRVAGWNVCCDLYDTVRDVLRRNDPAEKAALVEAIKKEIAKGKEALAAAENEITNNPRVRRGTRYGARIGARYDRAYNKVQRLEEALAEISNLSE